MNKTQYLANPEVAKFVDWLAENHDKLEISLCIKGSKFVPSGLTKILVGLEKLLDNYKWVSSWVLNGEQVKSSDWLTTQASLERLGNELKAAIDTKNADLTLEVCSAILVWGGQRDKTKGAQPFLEKKHKKGLLVDYLLSVQKCIALETTDLTNLATVEMMNSMLTKVYSLQAKDGLPIYDSRVAAAIACLVELYRQQKQLSWKCVPSELVFPVLDQRTIRTVKGLTENLIVGSHTRMDRKNTQQWVSASIKLGWIMQAVLNKASNLFADQKSRLHAFEASLFMMGYDVASLKSNLPKHK